MRKNTESPLQCHWGESLEMKQRDGDWVVEVGVEELLWSPGEKWGGQSEIGHFQREERKTRPRQFPAETPVGITSFV